MNFIILAAGIGSRLRPLTENRPKCCILINESSIIKMLLKQIRGNFISANIIIVTGYKDEYLRNHIGSEFGDINFVHNVDYENTNNMYSASLAIPELNTSENVVSINADCIYEDKIFAYLKEAKESTIFTDNSFFDEESMKVKIENGCVVGMSKLFANSSNTLVSIDLYFFKYDDFNKLASIFNTYLKNRDLIQWTEVAINDLVNKNKSMIKNTNIENSKWYEIDTIEDLSKAREKWKKI